MRTTHFTRDRRTRQRGVALFLTFLLMLVLAGLAVAVATFSQNSLVTGRTSQLDRQAFYIAEAGWQRARQAITAGTWTAASSPGNTYNESFGAGEYLVTIVDNGSNSYTITSNGYVPDDTTPAAKRQFVESSISVTPGSSNNLSLTATASASSSNGSNTPGKANDNNNGTRWEAGTNGSGSWLAMDYGSATTVDKVVVQEHNFIDGLTIEWSDDASSWTAESSLSVVESPAKTWTATFTAASHRYVRSRFTSVPSGKAAAVTEMESYNTTAAPTLGSGTASTAW